MDRRNEWRLFGKRRGYIHHRRRRAGGELGLTFLLTNQQQHRSKMAAYYGGFATLSKMPKDKPKEAPKSEKKDEKSVPTIHYGEAHVTVEVPKWP